MFRKVGFFSALTGILILLVSALLTLTETVGTNDALYRHLQVKYGVLDWCGLDESGLRMADRALADCLCGDADALNGLRLRVYGTEKEAFNDREKLHMDDCRRLFDLLRSVRRTILPIGICLTAVGYIATGRRKRFRRAARLAPLILMLPIAAFVAWAVKDFNAAFNFFHGLLFTNDLWLLNPATDLLIRICPAEMFAWMGGLIAVGELAVMVLTVKIADGLTR